MIYLLFVFQIFGFLYLKNKIRFLNDNLHKVNSIIASDEKLNALVEKSKEKKELPENKEKFPYPLGVLNKLRIEALAKSKNSQEIQGYLTHDEIKSIALNSVLRLGDPKFNDLIFVTKDNIWRISHHGHDTLEKYKSMVKGLTCSVILDQMVVEKLVKENV